MVEGVQAGSRMVWLEEKPQKLGFRQLTLEAPERAGHPVVVEVMGPAALVEEAEDTWEVLEERMLRCPLNSQVQVEAPSSTTRSRRKAARTLGSDTALGRAVL